MKTFFELWQSHVKSAGYASVNAFLLQHDPKGSGYQTLAKKMTRIPAHGRVAMWADILGLEPGARAEWLNAAERDRAIAASGGKELGPGIRLLNDDLAKARAELQQARADLARDAQQLAELRAVLRDIVTKIPDVHLSPGQLKALGL